MAMCNYTGICIYSRSHKVAALRCASVVMSGSGDGVCGGKYTARRGKANKADVTISHVVIQGRGIDVELVGKGSLE